MNIGQIVCSVTSDACRFMQDNLVSWFVVHIFHQVLTTQNPLHMLARGGGSGGTRLSPE